MIETYVFPDHLDIKKKYFQGSNAAEIWALTNGQFWVNKSSTNTGVLVDTYPEALGYRRYFRERYRSLERLFGEY